MGRLVGWVACVVSFATGAIGTGLFTSVPHTVLLLLITGWVTTTLRPARQLGVLRTRRPQNAQTSVAAPPLAVMPAPTLADGADGGR